MLASFLDTLSQIQLQLLNFVRPPENIFITIIQKESVTRLRVHFGHLSDQRHWFENTLNPFCSCGNDIEPTYHYILHCPYYSHERITLMDKIKDINEDILKQNGEILLWTLILGDSKLSNFKNTEMLNCSIEFIFLRFDVPLLHNDSLFKLFFDLSS